jgi:hypothetical protein
MEYDRISIMKPPKLTKNIKLCDTSCDDLWSCVEINGNLYIPLDISAPSGYSSFSVEFTKEYAPYGYGQSYQYIIYGNRDETDEEYSARIEDDKRIKNIKKQQTLEKKELELKELERLKKKYEL